MIRMSFRRMDKLWMAAQARGLEIAVHEEVRHRSTWMRGQIIVYYRDKADGRPVEDEDVAIFPFRNDGRRKKTQAIIAAMAFIEGWPHSGGPK